MRDITEIRKNENGLQILDETDFLRTNLSVPPTKINI